MNCHPIHVTQQDKDKYIGQNHDKWAIWGTKPQKKI